MCVRVKPGHVSSVEILLLVARYYISFIAFRTDIYIIYYNVRVYSFGFSFFSSRVTGRRIRYEHVAGVWVADRGRRRTRRRRSEYFPFCASLALRLSSRLDFGKRGVYAFSSRKRSFHSVRTDGIDILLFRESPRARRTRSDAKLARLENNRLLSRYLSVSKSLVTR